MTELTRLRLQWIGIALLLTSLCGGFDVLAIQAVWPLKTLGLWVVFWGLGSTIVASQIGLVGLCLRAVRAA